MTVVCELLLFFFRIPGAARYVLTNCRSTWSILDKHWLYIYEERDNYFNIRHRQELSMTTFVQLFFFFFLLHESNIFDVT